MGYRDLAEEIDADGASISPDVSLGASVLGAFFSALLTVTGLLALLSTAALGWLALHRFRGNARALHAELPLADARPQLLISGLVILTALGALVFALVV